jgi:hypothetical protein
MGDELERLRLMEQHLRDLVKTLRKDQENHKAVSRIRVGAYDPEKSHYPAVISLVQHALDIQGDTELVRLREVHKFLKITTDQLAMCEESDIIADPIRSAMEHV